MVTMFGITFGISLLAEFVIGVVVCAIVVFLTIFAQFKKRDLRISKSQSAIPDLVRKKCSSEIFLSK